MARNYLHETHATIREAAGSEFEWSSGDHRVLDISRAAQDEVDHLRADNMQRTPRWIADLDRMVMTERQPDGSYLDAYIMVAVDENP